jgi:hypothetical protein
MGNQVIIAIRHDVSEVPSFDKVYALGLRNIERVTKGFEETNGIIVSHYHHASDAICLMVNNKGMTSMPAFMRLFDDTEKKTPFERLLSEYRNNRSYSVRKIAKNKVREANKGARVSIFGYLTDYTSEMADNSFQQMFDAITEVPTIENGDIHRRGTYEDSIDGTRIVKIATLAADQTALVELRHNVFNVTALPFAEMAPLADIPVTDRESSKAKIIDFDVKLLETFGYKATPTQNTLRYL